MPAKSRGPRCRGPERSPAECEQAVGARFLRFPLQLDLLMLQCRGGPANLVFHASHSLRTFAHACEVSKTCQVFQRVVQVGCVGKVSGGCPAEDE